MAALEASTAVLSALASATTLVDKVRGKKVSDADVDQMCATLDLAKDNINIMESLLRNMERKSKQDSEWADAAEAKIAELEAEVERLRQLVAASGTHRWKHLDVEIIIYLAKLDRASVEEMSVAHESISERDTTVIRSRLDVLSRADFVRSSIANRARGVTYRLKPAGRAAYADHVAPNMEHAESLSDVVGAAMRSLTGGDDD